MSDTAAIAASSANQAAPASTAEGGGVKLWSGLSFHGVFKDILDTINPLQHLPIVGSVYRYLTGDEPSGGARIAGDALYGGPIGFAVGVVSTLLLDKNGHDLGERTLAKVFGPSPAESGTMVASASTAAGQATAAPTPLTLAMPGQASPVPAAAASAQTLSPPQPPQSLFTSLPAPAAAATPAPAAPSAPQQGLPLQRQFAASRPTGGGPTLNNRPVPLELGSGLLPVSPPAALAVPGRRLAPVATATQPPAITPAAAAAPNPIAQKMLDALDKYERLKKQQEQQDKSSNDNAPKVDLAL